MFYSQQSLYTYPLETIQMAAWWLSSHRENLTLRNALDTVGRPCHSCNLGTRDTGAGGLLFWGHSETQSSKASWATVWDPVSKKEEKDYQNCSATTALAL